jgi:hypothetical protein
MINALSKTRSRSLLFLSFNGFALVFTVLFLIVPLWSHFSDRSEEISQTAAQLSHFQSIIRGSNALIAKTAPSGDPFLSGGEERVVSADLQANLKAIANAAGVRFLGIRALQGSSTQPPRMIAVDLELEGSLQAVRDVVKKIEDQTPLLFITAAILRGSPDEDAGLIRAELTVQGAMHANESLSPEIVAPTSELRSDATPDRER